MRAPTPSSADVFLPSSSETKFGSLRPPAGGPLLELFRRAPSSWPAPCACTSSCRLSALPVHGHDRGKPLDSSSRQLWQPGSLQSIAPARTPCSRTPAAGVLAGKLCRVGALVAERHHPEVVRAHHLSMEVFHGQRRHVLSVGERGGLLRPPTLPPTKPTVPGTQALGPCSCVPS